MIPITYIVGALIYLMLIGVAYNMIRHRLGTSDHPAIMGCVIWPLILPAMLGHEAVNLYVEHRKQKALPKAEVVRSYK